MKICRNCNYIRTEQDNLMFPEYECPSCGVIEKHKARYEFEKLEKKRSKERKVKLEKIKKEKELKRRREEAARKKKEEEERKLREEAERQRLEEEVRKKKQEEERLKKAAEEQKRRADEERRLREEAEKQRLEEEARKKKQEEARLQKEAEEQKRRVEEERRRREEEERQRLEEEARQKKLEEEERRRKERAEERRRKREEEEAKRLLQKRKEKTQKILKDNADKIITAAEDTEEYKLFDMCPFAISQTGKGLTFPTIGDKKNKLQHMRCIQKYCRLWTIKINRNGKAYAEGCVMQFQGLTEEEIIRNFAIKNEQIIGKDYPLDDISVETDNGDDPE